MATTTPSESGDTASTPVPERTLAGAPVRPETNTTQKRGGDPR